MCECVDTVRDTKFSLAYAITLAGRIWCYAMLFASTRNALSLHCVLCCSRVSTNQPTSTAAAANERPNWSCLCVYLVHTTTRNDSSSVLHTVRVVHRRTADQTRAVCASCNTVARTTERILRSSVPLCHLPRDQAKAATRSTQFTTHSESAGSPLRAIRNATNHAARRVRVASHSSRISLLVALRAAELSLPFGAN